MRTDHIPHLRVVPSAGPRQPIVTPDETGGEIVTRRPSIPCGGCQKVTAEGQLVTKYRRTWWHADCAKRDVEAGNAPAAWLALGHDLARSPRSYSVGETRAIVGALIGMIAEPEQQEPDDADYSPVIGGAS